MEERSKTLIIAFILFFIVISCIVIGSYIIIEDEKIKNNKQCRKAGLEEGCHFRDAECGIDCKYMDMEFHHYRNQGLGADDCFCTSRIGEVKNIW